MKYGTLNDIHSVLKLEFEKVTYFDNFTEQL